MVEKYGKGFVDFDLEKDGDFFIFPAFTDSHIHMRALISSQYIVEIKDGFIIENLQSSDNDYAIGRGWVEDFNPNILESLQKPALAIRVCGHVAYCNEKFKREFKLKSTKITENDLVNLFTILDEITLTEKSLEISEQKLTKNGIYRIIDMGATPRLLEILKKGKLKYNLFFDFPYKDFLLKNNLKFSQKLYDNVKVLGLKTYLDGSMGAKTAALLNNKAPLNYSNDEILKIFKEMDENGLAVAAHSIGDRAVRQFVEVTKDLKNDFHKIEHCQIVQKSDLKHLKNPGIQPYFYFSDRLWVDKNISKDSIFYPLRSLIETKPLGGSDFPVESFNPFKSIKNAIQRMDGEGIDLKSAIDMYTTNPDNYLGEKLDKWILIKDFYSTTVVVGEIK